MQYLLSRGARAVGLAGLIGALLGVVAAHPAAAATTAQIPATAASTDPATCASPNMSQTFLSVKDRNWYTLAPGQSPEGFTGSGWTLADGAGIASLGWRSKWRESPLYPMKIASRSRSPLPVFAATPHDRARMQSHSFSIVHSF